MYGPTGCCLRKETPSGDPRNTCQSFASGLVPLRRNSRARAVLTRVRSKRVTIFPSLEKGVEFGRAKRELSRGGIIPRCATLIPTRSASRIDLLFSKGGKSALI